MRIISIVGTCCLLLPLLHGAMACGEVNDAAEDANANASGGTDAATNVGNGIGSGGSSAGVGSGTDGPGAVDTTGAGVTGNTAGSVVGGGTGAEGGSGGVGGSGDGTGGDGVDGDGVGGSSGSRGGAGATTGIAGAAGATSDPTDLFTCNLPSDCPTVCFHIGLGDCGGDAACIHTVVSTTVETGAPAVLRELYVPGPGGYIGERLMILLDGETLVQQSRTRSCDPGVIECDLNALEWVVGDQQRCEYDACTGEGCFSYPQLGNCAPPTHEYTCDDIEAILGSQ